MLLYGCVDFAKNSLPFPVYFSVHILYFNRVVRTKKIRSGWESSIMRGIIEVVEKCDKEKGLNY